MPTITAADRRLTPEMFAGLQRVSKLSDSKLAAALGVDPNTIRRYKRDDDASSALPIPSSIARAVRYFARCGGVPADWPEKDVPEPIVGAPPSTTPMAERDAAKRPERLAAR